MPFFNKELLKAIMTRTKLLIILLRNRNEENSVPLLRKKKRFHKNLNQKSVLVNELFWKTIKPLLSDMMKYTT